MGIPQTNRPAYYYVVLCSTPLCLKIIYNRVIQSTRGVEIQLFCADSHHFTWRNATKWALAVFLFYFSKTPTFIFLRNKLVFFFLLENPGPPSATMCWQKQLSQLPIMWAFPLLSTIKGFGKSCQINLFCNSWLYYEVDIMRFFIHQLNSKILFFYYFILNGFYSFSEPLCSG